MSSVASVKKSKVPINALCLMESAKFYKIIKPFSVSMIRKILDRAGENKTNNFVAKHIRELFAIDGKNYKISYEVHKYTQEPVFLSGTEEVETIYGYCLLIELDNYLVVSGQHCSSISTLLSDLGELIDHNTFIKLFNDQDVQIEKLSLSSMTIAKMLIRKKVYEGNNISLSLPRNGLGREIPRNVKISCVDGEITFNMSSGGVIQKGGRTGLAPYVRWASALVDKINNASDDKDFLPGYAKPVEFQDAVTKIKPIGVLLHADELEKKIENNTITEFVYAKSNGAEKAVSKRLLDYGWRKFSQPLEIRLKDEKYHIINNGKEVGSIKVLKRSYGIDLGVLNRISIKTPTGTIPVADYIKENGYYSLTFSDPSYYMIYRKLFYDFGVLAEMERFLFNMIVVDNLDLAKSEKGDKSLKKIKFDDNCIFDIIENNCKLPNLICDDTGDEWADFIEFGQYGDDYRIRFIHCKHSDEVGLGASPFHIVVSQAIKNLSHLYANVDELKKKALSWEGVIKGTSISVIRKKAGVSIADDYEKMLNNMNVIREVVLAVSFLSKSQFATLINELKNGRPPKGYEVHLIWLLSTFISCCNQMGAQARLYVAP